MRVSHYNSASAFLQEAQPLLLSHEAENNLLLGLAKTLVADPHYYTEQDPRFFAIRDEDTLVGAAAQTPPFNLLIYLHPDYMDAAAIALCTQLDETSIDIPGVTGAESTAQQFARAWCNTRQLHAELEMEQLIYRLDQVSDVPTPDGTLREASAQDLPLLTHWLAEFYREVGMHRQLPNAAKRAKTLIDSASAYLWEIDRPVCMAATPRCTPNGVTISYVYTPPDARRAGYATGCVAKLSRRMLERFQFCTLHTDLANPTSNNIYKEIGYELVDRFRQYSFKKGEV